MTWLAAGHHLVLEPGIELALEVLLESQHSPIVELLAGVPVVPLVATLGEGLTFVNH